MNYARIILLIGFSMIVIISTLVFWITENEKSSFQLEVCKNEPYCFSAKVTDVIDGDTIYVKHLTTGDPIRIRLSLVDTDEIDEPRYLEGKEFTEKMCPVGSIIIVDQDDGQLTDSGGRMLAVVYCDGISLNKQLLEEELAEINYEFCEESEYQNEDWSGC